MLASLKSPLYHLSCYLFLPGLGGIATAVKAHSQMADVIRSSVFGGSILIRYFCIDLSNRRRFEERSGDIIDHYDIRIDSLSSSQRVGLMRTMQFNVNTSMKQVIAFY